jgi:uncharacterized glyoxalase superfamily protein PhnB
MPSFGSVVPVFRIFDEQKAREFYLGFLGFSVLFEHRFEDNFPLYMGIKLSNCTLHLSEHHGDACPGASIRIQTSDVKELHKALSAKDYKYAKPGGPENTPWGTFELSISDPFGNRLAFVQE